MTQPTKDAPKTESKPKLQFEHPGKKTLVLIPFDEKEAREVREKLEEPFSLLEVEPTVTQQLRIGMLTDQYVVYAAVLSQERVKGPDGRYSRQRVYKVHGPFICGDFLQPSTDDADMATVNMPELHDTIQRSLGPNVVARTSADKIEQQKTLKLFGC